MTSLAHGWRRGTGGSRGFLRLALFAVAFFALLGGTLPLDGGSRLSSAGQFSGASSGATDLLALLRGSQRGLAAQVHRPLRDTHQLQAGGTLDGIVAERTAMASFVAPQIAFSLPEFSAPSTPRAFDPRGPPAA